VVVTQGSEKDFPRRSGMCGWMKSEGHKLIMVIAYHGPRTTTDNTSEGTLENEKEVRAKEKKIQFSMVSIELGQGLRWHQKVVERNKKGREDKECGLFHK